MTTTDSIFDGLPNLLRKIEGYTQTTGGSKSTQCGALNPKRFRRGIARNASQIR
jgi:hypothetical protein